MVIRIATYNKKPTQHDNAPLMAAFHAWLRLQPGFRAGWQIHDSKSDKTLSVNVWADLASYQAMKDRIFPGASTGPQPDKVEIFDELVEF